MQVNIENTQTVTTEILSVTNKLLTNCEQTETSQTADQQPTDTTQATEQQQAQQIEQDIPDIITQFSTSMNICMREDGQTLINIYINSSGALIK